MSAEPSLRVLAAIWICLIFAGLGLLAWGRNVQWQSQEVLQGARQLRQEWQFLQDHKTNQTHAVPAMPHAEAIVTQKPDGSYLIVRPPFGFFRGRFGY